MGVEEGCTCLKQKGFMYLFIYLLKEVLKAWGDHGKNNWEIDLELLVDEPGQMLALPFGTTSSSSSSDENRV